MMTSVTGYRVNVTLNRTSRSAGYATERRPLRSLRMTNAEETIAILPINHIQSTAVTTTEWAGPED